MKKIICLLVLFISVYALVGCAKTNEKLDNILEKGEIVIVTSPDYAPFEFIDDSKTGDAKYVGSDIEFMKFIAAELGVTLRIEVADFDTTLASLGLGTGDLAISGYTYKAERAENYEMSVNYYEEGQQGILVKKENINKYGTFTQLNVNGVKIGAQAGTLQADFVGAQLPNASLESFSTIPNGIALLDNGAIDAIALASKVADIIVAKYPDKYEFINDRFVVATEETQLFVFAKKGETALIEKVNEIIQKVKDQNLYAEWDKEATEIAMNLGLI